MSAAGPGELGHVLFPAIARLAAGLLERHAQQHRPADAALIWEVTDLLAQVSSPRATAGRARVTRSVFPLALDTDRRYVMTYGQLNVTSALIRQLEAETRRLVAQQPEAETSVPGVARQRADPPILCGPNGLDRKKHFQYRTAARRAVIRGFPHRWQSQPRPPRQRRGRIFMHRQRSRELPLLPQCVSKLIASS